MLEHNTTDNRTLMFIDQRTCGFVGTLSSNKPIQLILDTTDTLWQICLFAMEIIILNRQILEIPVP